MKALKKIILVGIATVLAAGIAACDKPGPAETTGKKIDETNQKAGEVVGDAAITAKVKAAILAEPGLHSFQISVNTTDGAVTLSGAVDSQSNVDRAKEVAAAVAGVKKIDNQLTLSATK